MKSDSEWKERATALFFVEKKSINEIADILGHDRKTVRKVLSASEDFEHEKDRRKQQTKERNKAYKAGWDKENRKKPTTGSLGNNESMLLSRRHDIDVRILSRERIDGSRW